MGFVAAEALLSLTLSLFLLFAWERWRADTAPRWAVWLVRLILGLRALWAARMVLGVVMWIWQS